MSIKIDLRFTRTLDLDLLEKGVNIWLIRVTGQIKFKIAKGWSRTYEAIIDTGAPVSLIPLSIWKKVDSEIIINHRISGVVPLKQCSLPVKVGELTCALVGTKSISKNFKIKAYFAQTDRVPLIIGFDNLLTHLKFTCDCQNGIAYLEER